MSCGGAEKAVELPRALVLIWKCNIGVNCSRVPNLLLPDYGGTLLAIPPSFGSSQLHLQSLQRLQVLDLLWVLRLRKTNLSDSLLPRSAVSPTKNLSQALGGPLHLHRDSNHSDSISVMLRVKGFPCSKNM